MLESGKSALPPRSIFSWPCLYVLFELLIKYWLLILNCKKAMYIYLGLAFLSFKNAFTLGPDTRFISDCSAWYGYTVYEDLTNFEPEWDTSRNLLWNKGNKISLLFCFPRLDFKYLVKSWSYPTMLHLVYRTDRPTNYFEGIRMPKRYYYYHYYYLC